MPSTTLSPLSPARGRRNRLTRQLVGIGLAGCVALGAGVVSAPAASADIAQQIRDTQQRIDDLNTKAEAAAERYNAGRIALAKAQQRATTAQATLDRENRDVQGLVKQASAFAAQAYMSGVTGPGIAIMADGNPAQLLGQLATLDRIARTQSDVMTQLATARHRQESATAAQHAAAQQAAATLAGLQKDKRTVESAASQAQGLLSQLQAKQARMIQAAKDAAARRAAAARAAALAEQARQAAAALAAFRAQPVAVEQPVVAVTHYSGSAAQIAVKVAMSELGKPYVWGASGPDSFDCSGLTMYAYGAAGISLPHYTGAQWGAGRHVSRSELRPGDLIFFEQSLGHVGMYIGNGQFVHAPHTGDVVKVSSLSGWYDQEYQGAVRIAG
ncbi:MAG: NlpC/P60 family protein [Mycobacteriales bacterium]